MFGCVFGIVILEELSEKRKLAYFITVEAEIGVWLWVKRLVFEVRGFH
jgi:hypothetical protein